MPAHANYLGSSEPQGAELQGTVPQGTVPQGTVPPITESPGHIDPILKVTRRLALFISILLISGFSFYFYQFGIPVVPIIGAILMILTNYVLYRRAPQHYRSGVRLIAFFSALFLISLVFSFMSGDVRGYESTLKAPLGFALGLILLNSILRLYGNRIFRDDLLAAFNGVFILHVIALLVQVAYFLGTGEFLDYIEPITGEVSRHAYATFLSSPRFTGLFIEPAVCASFMFMGLSSRFVSGQFRPTRLDVLMLLAILMTFSISGLFLLGGILFAATRTSGGRIRLFSSFVVVLIMFTYLFSVDEAKEYYSARGSAPLEDSSGYERLVSGLPVWLEGTSSQLLIGYGIGSEQEVLESGGNAGGNGLMYLLVYFGVLGAVAILGFFMLVLRSTASPIISYLFLAQLTIGAPLYTLALWWLWLGGIAVTHRGVFRSSRY